MLQIVWPLLPPGGVLKYSASTLFWNFIPGPDISIAYVLKGEKFWWLYSRRLTLRYLTNCKTGAILMMLKVLYTGSAFLYSHESTYIQVIANGRAWPFRSFDILFTSKKLNGYCF